MVCWACGLEVAFLLVGFGAGDGLRIGFPEAFSVFRHEFGGVEGGFSGIAGIGWRGEKRERECD